MRLSRAVHDFMTGYFSTCRRSEKTRQAYQIDLTQFLTFAGACAWLSALRPELIEKWIGLLKEKGYAPASIQRKIASLKAMFHYWVRRDKLKISPTWKLRFDLGSRRVMPRALSAQDASALLSAARREILLKSARPASSAHLVAVRNCALVDLFLETGIRVSEMASRAVRPLRYTRQSV